MHDEELRRGADLTQRQEIAKRIVRNLAVEKRVGRELTQVSVQKRVAVGGRVRRELGADDAARARPRIDHDLLSPRFSHLLSEYAGERVRRTAGGERDDHAYR